MNQLIFAAVKNGQAVPLVDSKGDHGAAREVDLFEVLEARVRAGQDMHITGPKLRWSRRLTS